MAQPSSRTEPADEVPDDLDERRRHARSRALTRLAAASGADPDSWGPQVVVEPFAPGSAVVALGGGFDASGLEVLRGLSDELDRRAGAELVVDLTRTTGCDHAVARVVARWRIRRLAAGARVELHGAPPALRAELGQHATPF